MALQIFLARRFVTERAKDCTQHLSNSKKIIKINWFRNPLPLNNKNITWSQLFTFAPKELYLKSIGLEGRELREF